MRFVEALNRIVDALLIDIRYAWRSARKAPGFTAVVLLTLALGIGANTAIFSIVHAMLIQPLPYRDANQLAFIWLGARGPLSGPDFRDLREGNSVFSEIGGIWASGTVALSGEDRDHEQLRTSLVTTNFFQMLGAAPAFGRTFRSEDGVPDAPPTILLGWDLFSRRFGGDPSIVGRQIIVNDQPTTVIGVMPRAFRLLLPLDSGVPDHLQVWQPFWPEFERGPRGNQFMRVVGRMRPGVSIARARADVDAIARQMAGESGGSRVFTTVGLQADDTRDFRGPLLSLFAGVGILLMIAGVNVGGLLIARAASRAREMGLRLAIGASPMRLLRQSLAEGLLLALLGAAAGTAFAWMGLRLLLAFTPESLGRLTAARIDTTVFGYTMAVSLLWAMLFSLAPLAEIFKAGRPQAVLAQGTGRLTAAPVRYRARSLLLVVQIALSVVLLVGAGLLVRAFVAVQGIDTGFRADGRLTFRLALPDSRYPTTEAIVSADRRLRDQLASIPGVVSVGGISHIPFDDLPNWGLTYALDAAAPAPGGAVTRANTRAITAGLFESLDVRLLEGRVFDDADDLQGAVVIVDDLLAARLWPNQSAVGQSLRLGQASPDRAATVVGVVRHLRLRSIVEDLTPQIFIAYRVWQRSPMAYVVRTERDPASLVAEVRSAVAAVDARLPIYDIRTLDAYVHGAMAIRRFTMLLAAAFAATALVLTCIGVYGVLAYAVATRRHEFGVRRALGAGAPQLLREVFREGLGFALVGSAIGVGAALVAGRLLQNQLYGVQPRDPVAFGVSLMLVLIGATLACWIPGRRATAVSPMDALRAE
jgi:putative ABC transport system permease protein